MATFSAQVQLLVDAEPLPVLMPSLPLEAWQLAIIEWGNSTETGFVSHGGSIPVVEAAYPGIVINDARIAPDGFKRPKKDGPLQAGVVPTQSTSIKFQEKNNALGELIANKRANYIGVRGKIIRIYEWEAGEELDLVSHLVGTYRLQDRSWKDGYKTLSCIDIRRDLKEKILEPEAYRLKSSLTVDADALTLKLPYSSSDEAMPFMQHDEVYSSNPSETVLYVLLDTSEIIKLSDAQYTVDPSDDTLVTFRGVERGALNTAQHIAAITVEGDTEDDNLPALTEWVYIEETLPNLIRLLSIGETFDGRAAAKAHHTINMSDRWLDQPSLVNAANELSTLRLRVENYGSVSLKELIESEILKFLPGTLQVNRRGEISLKQINRVSENLAAVYKFDKNTIDRSSVSDIKTSVKHIKSAIGIKAGYDARTQKYHAPVFLTDSVQSAANDSTNDAEPLVLSTKLMHSSITTFAQIRRLIPTLAAYYLSEQLSFTFRAKPSAPVVDIGSVVDVHIEDVPDDISSFLGVPDIDRAFVVTNVSPGNNGTTYQVTGTASNGDDYYETLSESPLPDEEFLRNAIRLEDALPAGALLESGGIWYIQAGEWPLSFRDKYVFDLGPLTHTANSTITCAAGQEGGMFQLWCTHAWHSDSPTTVITTGKGSTLGGAAGEAGDAGYAVETRGVGSLSVTAIRQRNDSGDEQVTAWNFSATVGAGSQSATVGDMPNIALSYNDGVLTGLPTNLSGYGGCGGGTTRVSTSDSNGISISRTEEGGEGKRGSAGVMIICDGATMSPAARFITSGVDGDQPTTFSAGGAFSFVGSSFTTAAGSGSGPGSVIIGLNGPHATFDISSHVEAYAGITHYGAGSRMPTPYEGRQRTSALYNHYTALDYKNYSSQCSKVIYMPAAATVQDGSAFDSTIDEFFANQRDGEVEIFTGALPSAANYADAYITTDALNSNAARPPFMVFTSEGWVDYDWDNDSYKSLYGGLITMLREYGGTSWTYGDTFPTAFQDGDTFTDELSGNTYILRADGNHQLILRDDSPVGDERNTDFALMNTAQTYEDEGFLYYVGLTDASALPLQISNKATTVAPSSSILSVSVGGAFSVAINQPVLPAPSGASFTAYDDTSGQLLWTRSQDETVISGYRVYRDGVEIGVTTGNTLEVTGLSSGTTYSFSVVAYEASDESTPATTSGTTTGGTGPVSGVFSVVSDGPTVEVNGTQEMEGRGLYMEFRDSSNAVIFTNTVNFSGGNLMYLPPSPSSYSFWTGYVVDSNGDGFSLPAQPRTYTQ